MWRTQASVRLARYEERPRRVLQRKRPTVRVQVRSSSPPASFVPEAARVVLAAVTEVVRSTVTAARAVVVLCTRDGAVHGRLPAVTVRTPWWQDVAPAVEAVREAFGLEIVVLRMLSSELARPQGGEVTYLVEIDALSPEARASLQPFDEVLDDQPLRLPYALPGWSGG